MLNCKKGKTEIEERIDDVLEEMKYMSSSTDDYTKASRNLETLYRIREKEKGIDVDKLITIGVYLSWVVLILLLVLGTA